MRAELWDKFVHYRPETSEYSKMYQNLGAVAAADAEKIPQCLRLIAENLEKTNQTGRRKARRRAFETHRS